MFDRYRPPSSIFVACAILLASCLLPLAEAQTVSAINPSAGIIEGRTWIVIIDVVILIATILGATAILGNMVWRELYKGRASTVRMRLVQGLVFSDLTLGIVGIITSGQYLQGIYHPHGSSFCDAFGLLLVAVLWTEHMWTFALAFVTYMILIYPLHPLTRHLETSWWIIFVVIYLASFGLAILTYFLYGYYPVGGICYYGSNAGLYGNLMQFIPRAFVFVSIFFFYARLYVFLKRPDKIRASFSRSPGNSVSGAVTWQSESFGSTDGNAQVASGNSQDRAPDGDSASSRNNRTRRRSRASSKERIRQGFKSFTFKSRHRVDEKRGADADSEAIKMAALQPEGEEVRPKDYASTEKRASGNESSVSSGPNPSPEDIPPWERLELPAFQVDGQKYGGSGSGIIGSSQTQPSFWSDLKFGGRKRTASNARSGRPYSPANGLRSTGSVATRESASGSTKPLRAVTESRAMTNTVPAGPKITTHIIAPSPPLLNTNTFASSSPNARGVFDHPRRHPGDLHLHYASTEVDPKDSSDNLSLAIAPIVPTNEALTPSTSSSTQALLPSIRQGSADRNGSRRDSGPALSDATESRRGSGPVSFVLPPYPRKETHMSHVDGPEPFARSSEHWSSSDVDRDRSRDTGSEDENDDDDEEEDGEMDFAQFLDRENENDEEARNHRRHHSEETVLQQESTASYLNRKTAMLMLYFPLAYCLLFSVSLVRIIYDFVSDDNPVALRAVSRWFIFAQGAVDAFIYGFVEWNTKRIVRRKVRKGLMTPTNQSRQSWGAGVTAEQMLSSKKQGTANQNSQSRSSNQTYRRQTSSAV